MGGLQQGNLWPYSWWPIIRGVNRGRQRGVLPALATLLVLGLLSGCQAQSSVQAAQTAIVAGQTAIVAGQSALATVQPYAVILQGALAGANLDVNLTPNGVLPQDVTNVTIKATDAQGSLAQVDLHTRQAAATAALLAASQYFPNATIQLNVVDTSGSSLVSGNMAPGQQPSVQ
jgi:hypothetical protein